MIVIDERKRNDFAQTLESISAEVIQYLNLATTQYIQAQPNLKTQILRCFQQWVSFGLGQRGVQYLLQNSQVLSLCYNSIQTSKGEEFLIAIETLQEFINAASQEPSLYIYGAQLIESILTFKPRIESAIAQYQQMGQGIKDYEVIDEIEGLCRVYADASETFISLIVDQNQGSSILQILQILVDFYSIEECKISYEGIKILTRFWHQFCKYIKTIEDVEYKKNRKQFFNEMAQSLIPIVLNHIKIEPATLLALDNQQVILSDEESQSKFHLIGTIQDLTRIVGVDQMFSIFQQNFTELINGSFEHKIDTIEGIAQLEVLLSVITGIIELFDRNDERRKQFPLPILQELLVLSESIQSFSSSQLRNTIYEFIDISKYCISLNQDLIPNILKFFVAGFDHNLTFKKSASTFSSFCRYNSPILLSQLVLLNQVFTHYLSNKAIISKIIEGLAYITSHLTQPEQCNSQLQFLLQNPVIQLQNISQQVFSDKKQVIQEVAFQTDLISVCLKSIHGNSLCEALFNIFKQVFPILQVLYEKFQDDSDTIENLTRVIKHFVRILDKKYVEPFVFDLANLIVTYFKNYTHCSMLYLAEKLINLFHDTPEKLQILQQMFDQLVSHFCDCFDLFTQQLLQSQKQINEFDHPFFQQNPELIEDFFGMCVKYLKYLPRVVLESAIYNKLWQIAIAGIGFQHTQAANCLFDYIERFIDRSRKYAKEYNCYNFIISAGEILTQRLIKSILLVPPLEILQFVSDVIRSIIKFFNQEQWQPWIASSLLQIPLDCLNQTEKQKMIDDFQDRQTVYDWLETLYNRARSSALRMKIQE